MKKTFSIVLALLILAAGIHLSIAKHICGGEVVAVKWSLSGEKASCGMENEGGSCPNSKDISSDCCQDEISIYSVDSNYSPSVFHICKISNNISQVFTVPVSLGTQSLLASHLLCSSNEPPGKLLTSAVLLSNICVFRIWFLIFQFCFSGRVM